MAEASIVFRNEDMSGPEEIQVDTMAGAAALAARFRNAAHCVEVINVNGEVEHRWEKGNPDWANSDVLYFHNGYDPYDFERKGDGWWDIENRVNELSEMLAFAFDVAVGHKKPNDQYCYLNLVADPDWTLEFLIDEAEEVKQSARTDNADAWQDHFLSWMQNSSSLYIKYRVEYTALLIKADIQVGGCRVPWLAFELAEL